jgi:hypothetical protein
MFFHLAYQVALLLDVHGMEGSLIELAQDRSFVNPIVGPIEREVVVDQQGGNIAIVGKRP